MPLTFIESVNTFFVYKQHSYVPSLWLSFHPSIKQAMTNIGPCYPEVTSFTWSPSRGISDRCKDIHQHHYQQVENCAHNTHNAKHVFKVHLASAWFRNQSISHLKESAVCSQTGQCCVNFNQELFRHISATRGRQQHKLDNKQHNPNVSAFAEPIPSFTV